MSKMNNLKTFLHYFYEKPSALFCAIALYGALVLYNDNQGFIKEQQGVLREISATLVQI